MLCRFLPYINMNHHKYTHVLSLSHLPFIPHLTYTLLGHLLERQAKLPVSYSNVSLAVYFTHSTVYVSMLLSQFVPPFPSPAGPTTLFSIPALQIGSSVPFFSVPCACSVVYDSLQSQRLQTTRLLCSWSFSGKSTRAGCYFLFQGASRCGDCTPVSYALALAGRLFIAELPGEQSPQISYIWVNIWYLLFTLFNRIQVHLPH